MPIAAWDDIASVDDEQPAAPKVARFEDIASIEPQAASALNVARFDDIASIEPPAAPARPPQTPAVPFTPTAIRPMPSHAPGAPIQTDLAASSKPPVLDALGLQPRPPAARAPFSRYEALTGQPAPNPAGPNVLLDPVLEGVPQVGRGVAALGRQLAQPHVLPSDSHVMPPSRPGADAAAKNAISDVLEGAMKAGTPALVAAGAAAPLATAEALIVSTLAGQGLRAGAEAVGAAPENVRLAENLGAITGGEAFARTGGGDLIHRPVKSIIERLRRGRQPLATEVPHAAPSGLEPGRDLREHQGAPGVGEVSAETGGSDRVGQQPPPSGPGPNVAHVSDIVAIEPPTAAPAEVEGGRGAGEQAGPPRPAEAPPADVKAGASVPFMITKRMEADLRAKGFAQDAIDRMTPEEAHRHLVAPAVADRLDTGELQDRLPGDVGAVRDTNVATPGFEAPFTLEGEVDQTPRGVDQNLNLEGEPPKVAHVDDIVAIEPPKPPGPKEPRNNRAPETHWVDVDGATRRELRRIAVELDNTPYTPKNFNDAGRGRGGDLEVSGGSGGAPVYWDIVGGNPDSGRPVFRYSRGQVLRKLRAFLENGKRSVVSDLAVDVAQRRGAGELKATYPDSAGDLPGGVHVDLKGRAMPPEVRTVVDALQEHGAELRAEYRRVYGNDFSTDHARELLGAALSPEERLRLNPDLQVPARALAEAVRRDALREETPAGKQDVVLMTMGATGVGKSSVFEHVPGLSDVRDAAALQVEGTYKDFETARRHVQEAVDAGHHVSIVYVHREPVSAYEQGVLARKGDNFRPVTPEFHLEAHQRTPGTLGRLIDAFKDDPRVDFTAIENSGAKNEARLVDPDTLRQVRYDEQDVRSRLEAALQRAEPEKARAIESARARVREARSGGGNPPAEVSGREGAGDAGAGGEVSRARAEGPGGGADVSRKPASPDEPLARPLGSRRADASGALTPTPGQRAISLLPKGERQLRPSEIVRDISKRLDNLPVNTGRFRQRALGIYKPQEQTIRLKVANDLDTLAHELGHHIHETVIGGQLPPKVYRDELLPIGAPTSRGSYTLQQKLAEGQAEFTRHYLTDPATAKKLAPTYFDAFEKGLAQHPELQAIIQRAQRQYIGHLSQDPVVRGMSHIDFSGQDPNPKGDLVTRLQAAVVDDLAAIKAMTDDLRDTKPIATSADGYVLARLARGSSAKADGFLRHGVRDADGTFLARSLEHALAPAKSQPREFASYLVASRVPELRARGMETALSIEEARAILKKFKSPEFDAARQAVYDYQDGLLEYARRSKAISGDQIAAMKQLNEYYVPFQRVLDDVGQAVSGSGKGGIANRANPTKRIKGSGRDIINPLESIVKNTHALVNLVEQNRAMLALVDQARGTQGGGRYLEQVPKSQLRTLFNLDKVTSAIKEQLDSFGVDYPDNLDFDKMVQVFTPAQIPVGQRGIVTVLRNGEREWYQVNEPALFDAITAIGSKAPGIIAKIFMPPVRMLRAGATLSLGFIGRNPIRDTFEATVNSRYGFRLGYDTLRGLFEYAKHGEDYQNFLNSGAGNASLVGMDRNRVREELGRLGIRDRTQLVKDIVRSPIDLLRAMSEAMEHATRLGEFKRALDVEGRTTEGYARAALAARDVTLDFARGGTWSKEINQYTAFFNAGVQGTARLAEVFKADPVGATMRAAAAMTVPAIALWVLNHNDPEYKELADWEKNAYYHVPIGRGAGHSWAKIPKSFTLGAVFSNPVEAALEYMNKKDPHAFARLVPDENAAWHLLGSLMFTAYMPALESWTNYDTFRDRNIVNPDDLQLDTALQANRWTSDIAKFVGPRLQLGNDPRGGMAPAKLDHLIYGYGGGLAGGVAQAADTVFETLGLARKKPAGGGGRWPFVGAFYREAAGSDAQSLQEFYRLRDKVTGAVSSLHHYEKTLEPGKIQERQQQAVKQFGPNPDAIRTRVNQAAQTLTELRTGVDQVFANPRMTPAEKKELLDRLYEQMINVARHGLGKDNLPSRFDHPPAPALLEKLDHPLAGTTPAQTSAAR